MLKFLEKAYDALVFIGSLLKSPILLFIRLYWGWLFINSGWGKLQDIDKFADFLEQFHFVLPRFQAYLAGGVEFLGGLCLMLGLASRLVAFLLSIVMITAYSTAHVEALREIFTNPSAFVAEAPFNFLLTTLIIFAFGPGRFSIDFLLERWVFKRSP